MPEPNKKPEAVFQKGLQIFQQIAQGHTTVEALEHATGYPATTIIRVAFMLAYEDDIVVAATVDGALRLSAKIRGNPSLVI